MRYPEPGGWYFVELSDEISEQLRKLTVFEAKKVGLNYIKVRATIGHTSWSTTLFPQKNGPYLIAIKESVRKKEGIIDGHIVRIECEL